MRLFIRTLGVTVWAGLLMASPVLAGNAASAGGKGAATLVLKVGSVEVLASQAAGSGQWVKAKKGMLLFEGDRIKTRELARAAVILEDGSLIRLNENTDLLLKARKTAKNRSRLEVLLGNLWAKVTRQEEGRELEIETPSAVAAIKGTEFEVMVVAGGESSLIVWDGMVRFFNPMGDVLVNASHRSSALPGKPPQPPVKIDLKSLEPWFASLAEEPADKILKTTVRDGDGKDYNLNLQYRKK